MTSTVLLIDDSATTRSILKVYLTGLDVVYLEAADGQTAWSLLQSNRVQLVIADVNMPGMDGLTLVRLIRASANPALRNVPVVVLTGDKSDATRRAGFDSGANSFVNKPVGSDELRAAVLRWIPQSETKSSNVVPFKSART